MAGAHAGGATAGAGHRVVMLGKPDCHLCGEARATIERVAGELGVPFEVRDITLASEEEREEYWDRIPVTFVDGAQHDFWRVSEKRLRAALEAPATRPRWRIPWSRR